MIQVEKKDRLMPTHCLYPLLFLLEENLNCELMKQLPFAFSFISDIKKALNEQVEITSYEYKNIENESITEGRVHH